MNHLAHALFSPADPEIQVGNIMADMIRRDPGMNLAPGIQAGIQLHQRLDRFVDAHEGLKSARGLISDSRRRYAPVLLDVFFDFYLASLWENSNLPPLGTLVDQRCREMERHLETLPLHYPNAIRRMVINRWITYYGDPHHLKTVINGLSRRARPGNPLLGADLEYKGREALFQPVFKQLLVDLMSTFETDPLTIEFGELTPA